MTDLRLSEIFESIQGEGVSAGEPALFVRLALCNLTCSFCDTKYTWDWTAYRYDVEVHTQSVDQLLARIRASRVGRLIVTGGEPLIQQRALAELFALLPAELVIEIETNGTLEPLPALARRVDQWNVSPKLASSGVPERRRLKTGALAALGATGRTWLKLVIDADSDLVEADALIDRLEWPRDRVLFMPQARTREELARRSASVRDASERRGFRFSTRLHIERWGGQRGV